MTYKDKEPLSLCLTLISSDDHLEWVTLSLTIPMDDFVSVAHSHVTRITNLDSVMVQAYETFDVGVLWYLAHFNFSSLIQCFDFGRQKLKDMWN